MRIFRCLTKSRPLLSPFNSSINPQPLPPLRSSEFQAKDDVVSFKEWFQSRNNPLIDQVFDVLRHWTTYGNDDSNVSLALFRLLGPRLSETLVLDILNYHGKNKDALSCLKFFDWAGHQRGFYHSRATFAAIFKILSREKLMSLMLDFLDNYTKQRYAHKDRFYNTLITGYAVVGKPEVALQLFRTMRFRGTDLDGFAYHVLLNALVEQNCFDAVEVVAKQIVFRGFESEVTHLIMMKNYCKQGQFDRAEESLRRVADEGGELSGDCVRILIDVLHKGNKFEKAAKLLEEFQDMGMVRAERAYGVWIQNLVRAGRIDGAV